MKYTKLLVIIAVMVMFAFVTVYAQEQTAPAPAAKPEMKKEMKKEGTMKEAAKKEATTFGGKVTAVDAMKNTFTVTRSWKDKAGKAMTKSETFEAGKDVKIADIAKDAKVVVTYKKEDGKMMAESVKPMKVMEKKEGAKMEKKAEAAPAPAATK